MVKECVSCGQTLPAHRGVDHPSVPPDIPLLDEGKIAPPVAPEPAPGLGRSILAGFAAFGILWVLVSIFSAPSNSEDAASSEESPPSISDDEDAETPAVDTDDLYLAREPGNSVDAGVRMLRRHLDSTDQTATIMYRFDEGLSIINLRTGDVRIEEVSDVGEIVLSDNTRLLEADEELIVVDLATGGTRSTPITQQRAVRKEQSGVLTLFDTEDGIFIVVDGEDDRNVYPVPRDAEILELSGYGFVVIASDNTSRVVTLDGLKDLSDHRVLAATEEARLEVRCTGATDCALVIVSEEGETTLPANFDQVGDQYLLSPDGRAVLRWEPSGHADVHVPSSSYTTTVGTGVRHPVWSSDSSFVAWLDLDAASPRLKALLHERREWLSWEIETMNAPEPTGTELTIW